MIHFFEIFLNAKYKSFNADSSFGNDPRFLLTLRNDRFRVSVVGLGVLSVDTASVES